MTATTFGFGGFAREQICIYACPWPRIQAAMMDEDTTSKDQRRGDGDGGENDDAANEPNQNGDALALSPSRPAHRTAHSPRLQYVKHSHQPPGAPTPLASAASGQAPAIQANLPGMQPPMPGATLLHQQDPRTVFAGPPGRCDATTASTNHDKIKFF